MKKSSQRESATPGPLTIPRVNLVGQAVEMITREISAGRWTASLPPERTLCQLLQISRTTVRAALAELERNGLVNRDENGRPIPTTSPRVPSTNRQTTTVVVLSPLGFEELGRFELIWLDALREQLAGHGLGLQMQTSPRAFGPQPRRLLSELTQQHPEAIWILLRSSQPMQQWFERQQVRAVIAGSRHDSVGLPSVEVDVEAASRHAAHHLTSRGHRRIAFFIEPSPAAGVTRSEEAFIRAAKGAESAEIVHHGTTRAEFLRILSHRLSAPNAPTGLLVERYTHALTALTWLLSHGVRWPGPIALLSREDTASFDHTAPGITSYQFDPQLFARKISRIVLGMSQGSQSLGGVHAIEPKLVRRETA